MQIKADWNFRPSVDRAIYICGKFDSEACRELLPQINTLRSSPDRAITVYINSPGGSTAVLDTIVGLLKHVDLNGIAPRLITVVSGEAASAAAMLLAMGDYAIAYPHSIVHFHGIRLSEIRDLTTEKASNFSKALALSNRGSALRVANEAIKRLAHRYSIKSVEFAEIRSRKGNAAFSNLECFVMAIAPRLTEAALLAAGNSLNESLQVELLSEATFGNLTAFTRNDSQLKRDIKVLQALLKHESKKGVLGHSSLDDEGMAKLVSDYFLLRDYYFGEHSDSINWICDTYGVLFLEGSEVSDYQAIEGDEDRKNWLRKQVPHRIAPFWYFTVLLCRRLHQGENRLCAEDAYWLGLVDEVVGTEMTGYRSIMEQQLDETQPELPITSASVSEQQPLQSQTAPQD